MPPSYALFNRADGVRRRFVGQVRDVEEDGLKTVEPTFGGEVARARRLAPQGDVAVEQTLRESARVRQVERRVVVVQARVAKAAQEPFDPLGMASDSHRRVGRRRTR